MIAGTTFWVCEKCGCIVKQKHSGTKRSKIKMRCDCKKTDFTYDELKITNGKISNERCLQNGWCKVKVLVSCND